jgi:hypothetical protein
LEEGIWSNAAISDKITIQGGWIRKVLPRSTNSWYNTGASLGTYPVGVSESGVKSGYAGNVESYGLGIINIKLQPAKGVTATLWNSYFENVMNTAIAELLLEQKSDTRSVKFYQGMMFLHQDAVGNGGNSLAEKAYMRKGTQSNVVSLQAGISNKKLNTSINYTHITGDGRYLMPREWGREFFYTFMPRERNEGAGNVHAFMVKTQRTSKNNRFKTGLGYGYYNMPDVKNYRLNKYGMPSYHQINHDVSYKFGKFLNGFELRTLLAWKINEGQTYGNLRYHYNKTDMLNVNVILDFRL